MVMGYFHRISVEEKKISSKKEKDQKTLRKPQKEWINSASNEPVLSSSSGS
jgi:hypothetical protein